MIINTRYGQVKGTKDDGIAVWKGIAYAKAPVGTLRFKAPQAPEAWDGVYDATHFGPAAMQPRDDVMNFLGSEGNEISEDCLNLNIWSPAVDEKLRPVMVWIHGGAFLNGTGTSGMYDGKSFATNGDVVVVTINYRLGVMGFLHLGEIGGDAYGSSGNCGILDQVAALQWVKENIESFGGDPNQITIFGESAGAMSVGTLLAMPAAKELFNQAILQSGAASNVLSSESATSVASKVLTALGVEANELEKLADIPAEKLLEATKHLPMMALGPVVDGTSIPQHPEVALANGSSKDIPILIGTNKDEYRLFTFLDPTWKQLDEAGVAQRFEKAIGPVWKKVASHFESQKLDQTLFEKVMSFNMFTYPAIRLAEQQIKQGAPAWMYRFDWNSPVFNGGLKACHALEIPFVWNNTNKPGVERLIGETPNQQIANQMHQAWIAFAHHGNPNTSALPNWEHYDVEKRATMIFNDESKLENDPDKEDRNVWEQETNHSK